MGSEPEINIYLNYMLPEYTVDYPSQTNSYRAIPSGETNSQAIEIAKSFLNTTINNNLIIAFIIYINSSDQNDRRIYLKSGVDTITFNTTSNTINVNYIGAISILNIAVLEFQKSQRGFKQGASTSTNILDAMA